MNELWGTIPGWITASGVVSMLGLWLRYLTTRRAQDGIRLTDLERENRQLRSDFDQYRRECIAESDRNRELINGLRSQMQQLQMHELEKAGAVMAPATRKRFAGGKT